MDEASTSAILAFYNLLAAKIGLEDCRSLKEVYNLMPILAHCMKKGTPIFVDDPTFDYRSAIDLIAHEMDEEFHSQLNSDAAEKGDEFEAAKIHLAMIYTFRLVKAEAFSTICEQLEAKHQWSIAYMIERLDDRHRWTFHPWPKLLHSDQQKQYGEDKEENKENEKSIEGRLLRALNGARTPTFSAGRKSLFHPSTNSPVKKVVGSPRGDEVVRIHTLERDVKALRQIRDIFGREKDKAEELCQQKERENNGLMKKIERLQAQIALMAPEAERVSLLEEQLLSMEKQNAALAKQLQEEEKRALNAGKFAADLNFELRRMDIKNEHLEKQVADQEAAMRMTRDESATLEQLRKKLSKLEDQEEQNKAQIRELQNKLKRQEEEKVEEMALLQIELQELKLGNEAKVAGNSLFAEVGGFSLKQELEHELSETKRTMNELLELAKQQKEVIAELDHERMTHDTTKKELNKTNQELDKTKKELDRVKRELDRTKRELNMAKQELDALRAWRRAQQQNSVCTSTIRETRNKFANKEELANRFTDKDYEKRTTVWPMTGQCKARAEEKMPKTLDELKDQEEKCNLQRETTDSAANDDERLKELRERNRRYPPHMRSYYLPEFAHLKNSETDLDVMP